MRIGSIASICVVLSATFGCAIKIDKIRPTPTTIEFGTFSCETLDVERLRIEKGLFDRYWDHHHGSIEAVAKLKGEMNAANDAIMRKGCQVPLVKIPHPPEKGKVRYTGGAPYEGK